MQNTFFKAINQESSKLKNQRALHSNRFYEQGMALLEQVQEAQFKNAALLPQACELFINAIKNNREDVRPCFALAYVFLILQDFDMALEYLKAVLEKDPQHTLARRMKAQVLSELEAAKKGTQPSGNDALSDKEDPYERLEDEIQKRVRKIMHTPFPSLVFEAGELKTLSIQSYSEQADLDDLHDRIMLLAQEYETLTLQQALQPIESHVKRLTQLVEINQTAWQIFQKIEAEMNLVEQCHQEARHTQNPEDIAILEENLEALYANQADYANALHELSQQGHHLGRVHESFQRLGLLTQSLEDVIDEATERLT